MADLLLSVKVKLKLVENKVKREEVSNSPELASRESMRFEGSRRQAQPSCANRLIGAIC